MANGNIKVSTDVLAKFSELYSVSLDYHLGTQSDHSDIEVLPMMILLRIRRHIS